MAHTPGPWCLSWEGEGWEDGGLSIVAHQLGEVCYIDNRLGGFYQDHWTPRTHEDHENNAKLIAAAPDLLAALKLLRNPEGDGRWICYCEDSEHAGMKCENCVATDAINKAEGRTA